MSWHDDERLSVLPSSCLASRRRGAGKGLYCGFRVVGPELPDSIDFELRWFGKCPIESAELDLSR